MTLFWVSKYANEKIYLEYFIQWTKVMDWNGPDCKSWDIKVVSKKENMIYLWLFLMAKRCVSSLFALDSLTICILQFEVGYPMCQTEIRMPYISLGITLRIFILHVTYATNNITNFKNKFSFKNTNSVANDICFIFKSSFKMIRMPSKEIWK